jgi:hypothetical protein
MAEEKDVVEQEVELEVVDDTPPEDRGREPMPKELVKELEEDELEDYSEKVKSRLKQMKKVWHDERREKEAALREQQAAIEMARKVAEENRALKARLTDGEKSLVLTATSAAELEMEMAKRAYKEAYEAGDSDKLVDAQEKLNSANYRLQRLKGYKPPVQEERNEVNIPQAQPQEVHLDPKTDSWRRQNTWFGSDEEMTASALGLHQKLEKQYGKDFVNTDKYWSTIDSTMRKRFPEHDWGDGDDETFEVDSKPAQRTERSATVVAPVSRSTSAKKVRLSQTQLNVIKKMGITPEQYAKEMMKLEKQNG